MCLSLSEPLGIFFDEDCGVKGVKEDAQAAKLGVCEGWKALSVAGTPLQTTKELVARVQALKAEGANSAVVAFSQPPVERSIDLSRPLGIGFGDDLVVKAVQPGSQGSELGVQQGRRPSRDAAVSHPFSLSLSLSLSPSLHISNFPSLISLSSDLPLLCLRQLRTRALMFETLHVLGDNDSVGVAFRDMVTPP